MFNLFVGTKLSEIHINNITGLDMKNMYHGLIYNQ